MFAASPTSKLSEAWPTTTKITTTKTKTTATAHETQINSQQTNTKKKTEPFDQLHSQS